MKGFLDLMYRLFFTKDDNLDLAQLYLLSFNIVFIIWIINVGVKAWTLSEPMLDAFLIIYSTTVLLSSPTWLVKLWLENKDWFRRGAVTNAAKTVEHTATPVVTPSLTTTATTASAVFIPPTQIVDPTLTVTPTATTDVSEVNVNNAVPVIPPTAFPLAQDTVPTSPTNVSFKG